MKWYLETGPQGDIAVSTRIRLARNLSGMPFPSRMTPEQGKKVIADVQNAVSASGSPAAGDLDFLDMESMTPARAMSLAERHLISPEFAQARQGRGLLLTKDESVSVMINEEDHIRIQAMLPGIQLKKALGIANQIDDLLDGRLPFAFDENLGYLTSCPTNLGTGLRASLMLHLPAIAQAGSVPELANAVSKLGFTIRGIYGEGSEPKGAFYQISNQVTLGISETQAIENLDGIVRQVMEQERMAREGFHKLSPQFEDTVYRSLGLLQSARLMSGDEFMAHISNLRLGIVMGVVKNISLETVNGLINDVQPATLMATSGKNLDAQSRDILRAQIVRERLSAQA